MFGGLVDREDVQAFIRTMAKTIVGEQTAECQKGILGNVCQRQNGGQRQLSPLVSGRPNRHTILDISGENASAPQAVICTLAAKRLTTPADTALPYYLRAHITWGAGKQTQEVSIDYLHGTRICFDASSIRVEAEYVSFGTVGAELGPRYNVGASIVYGNVGTQATFTDDFIDLAAAAGSARRPIPAFAQSLTVMADTELGRTSTTALAVEFSNRPTLGAGGIIVDMDLLQNEKILIPNGAEFYSITNNTAGAVRFSPVFGLYI